MANTKLALMALSKGVDQIPDHIIETIPIYRPPKEVRHQRRREQREQEESSSPTDSKRSSPPKSKSSRRRYSDDPPPNRGSTSSATNNSNRSATDQSDRSRQELEPDQEYYKNSKDYAFDQEAGHPRSFEPPNQQEDQTETYVPNRYIPPGAPPHIANENTVEPPPMGDNYYAPTRDDYSNRRYNPQDYAPQDNYGGGYGGGGQQYLQAPARYRPQDQRAHSAGPRYDDRYDDDDDSYDSRGRDSDRKGKHQKQRSRSRSHGAQHVLHRNFDTTDKGMAYGALGAIAGGALGHHFGKGPLATVAGAVVGGLGANALEARHERRKSGRLEAPHKHTRSRSTDYAGSRGDDPIDGTTRRDLEYYGSRRDRGYDDYSDEEDRPRRRSSQRRKSRGADEDDRY